MSWVVVVVIAGLLLWAVAEAFVWPVAPDAPLAVVAFLAPQLAAAGLLAVALGSALGGMAAIMLRRRGFGWSLPMTTESMRSRVHEWMDAGPRGLRHQPLTGVPYKVFVLEAAGRGFPIAAWGLLTVALRGARMLGVVVASGIAAWLVDTLVGRAEQLAWKLAVVGIGIGAFVTIWRLAWVVWNRRSPDARPGASQPSAAR